MQRLVLRCGHAPVVELITSFSGVLSGPKRDEKTAREMSLWRPGRHETQEVSVSPVALRPRVSPGLL